MFTYCCPLVSVTVPSMCASALATEAGNKYAGALSTAFAIWIVKPSGVPGLECAYDVGTTAGFSVVNDQVFVVVTPALSVNVATSVFVTFAGSRPGGL